MIGQRAVIKVDKPQGDFDFPISLKDTEGVIVYEFPSSLLGGALIRCDADGWYWAFNPSEYEIISDKEELGNG